MENSEIQEICKKIYKKHKKALDLIFEYKPDKILENHDFIIDVIRKRSEIILDSESKKFIRFIPKSLDFIKKDGDGWTKSKRILLFEIYNDSNGINLYLIIGPGPKEIRNKIYHISRDNKLINFNVNRKLTPRWFAIYKKNILRAKEFENNDREDLKRLIGERLNDILTKEITRIVNIFKNQKAELNDYI